MGHSRVIGANIGRDQYYAFYETSLNQFGTFGDLKRSVQLAKPNSEIHIYRLKNGVQHKIIDQGEVLRVVNAIEKAGWEAKARMASAVDSELREQLLLQWQLSQAFANIKDAIAKRYCTVNSDTYFAAHNLSYIPTYNTTNYGG